MPKLRVRRTKKRICSQTGKRSFLTKLDAKMEIANFPHVVRAYRCPHGEHWHTTTRR